jgi:hypothetical protein
MMEMQEQQENAWKEQLKEHRVKELSKDKKSAPEVTTKRDMVVEAKLISNEDWDRELDRATEVFDAESKFRRNRNPNKLNSINQTSDYDLWQRERAGDVAHAMELHAFESTEGSLQPALRRGRSSSSRPEGPSSSSGGPPPPPPPAGATMSGQVPNAMATGGRGAWEVAKFDGQACREVGNLVGDVVGTGMKIYGEPSEVATPGD